jgi:hypothetical protein
VSFSVERVIAVYLPLKCRIICHPTKIKLSVFIIAVIGMLLYSFNLKKISLNNTGTVTVCTSVDNSFSKTLSIMDIVFTMILPFVIITIINILIVLKLIKVSKSEISEGTQVSEVTENNNPLASIKRKFSRKVFKPDSIKSNNPTCSTDEFPRRKSVKIQSNREIESKRVTIKSLKFKFQQRNLSTNETIRARKKIINRANKFLFSVSISFLVLHAPIALVKFFNFHKFHEENVDKIPLNNDEDYSFGNMSNQENTTIPVYLNISNFYLNFNPINQITERICTDMYYINFVLNFFLYSLSGSKFRESLIRIVKIRTRPWGNTTRHPICDKPDKKNSRISRTKKSQL